MDDLADQGKVTEGLEVCPIMTGRFLILDDLPQDAWDLGQLIAGCLLDDAYLEQHAPFAHALEIADMGIQQIAVGAHDSLAAQATCLKLRPLYPNRDHRT